MAIITDIEKLRPELLDKSSAELERLRNEIDMAIAHKTAKEEAEKRAALIDEAGSHIEAVLKSVKWLHENGFLPERLETALTRGDGQFNPATFLRQPRADDVLRLPVKRASGGQKRTRRVRDEHGNLVPSKASRRG